MAQFAERRMDPVRAPFDLDRRPERSRTAGSAPGPGEAAARRARRTAERRRRERHLRLLRRDWLVDLVLAVLLMIVMLSVTAGLGVIALIEIPAGAVTIGSFVVERRRRRRSALGRRTGRDASRRRR